MAKPFYLNSSPGSVSTEIGPPDCEQGRASDLPGTRSCVRFQVEDPYEAPNTDDVRCQNREIVCVDSKADVLSSLPLALQRAALKQKCNRT
ncbi:hypothetical protein RRG08_056222 [Elysia crispata]|uniref:Uncharacterized protein n=1 Tax=Elysia crispata TaxID=231223 RepID=A0AAE1D0J9_9GAST|nr:hypothetical protein RRG08_056222 [Elysia crispata]